MTNTRYLPRRLHPPIWVALFSIVLLSLVVVQIVFEVSWLVAIPISIAVLWGIYTRFFIKCPSCGRRLRPREVRDPWSGLQRVLYDCQPCDTEWVSDIRYSDGADSGD